MHIVAWLLAIPCIFYLLYPAGLWLFSLTRKRHTPSPTPTEKTHISCIITAYRSLALCKPLIESIKRTNYPNLEIIVVADQCDPKEAAILQRDVELVSPSKPINSKIRSAELGLNHSSTISDGILILDPDNLLAPAFFTQLNTHTSNFKAVQAIRIAKNQNNSLARADALGEYYHNFSERLIPFRAGGSPTFAGSGMYINKELLKEFFASGWVDKQEQKGTLLGEDKLLQYFIVNNGERIGFAPEAIVYDEKVQSSKQVHTQRARWINTYFENLSYALSTLKNGLSQMNRNKIISGLTGMKPPLLILFLVTFFLLIAAIWVDIRLLVTLLSSIVVFVIYFIYASFQSPHARNVGLALLSIPRFVAHQFIALIKSRGQRNTFVVTDNSHSVSIDDVD